MKPLVLVLAVGLVGAAGCGRHHQQAVRPAPPAVVEESAANDEKPPPRIINGESETVKNWSTGGP